MGWHLLWSSRRSRPAAEDRIRARDLRMKQLLSRGTNGKRAQAPPDADRKWQDASLTGTLIDLRRIQLRLGRMEIWLAALASVAIACASTLAAAGWTLGNVWAVAGAGDRGWPRRAKPSAAQPDDVDARSPAANAARRRPVWATRVDGGVGCVDDWRFHERQPKSLFACRDLLVQPVHSGCLHWSRVLSGCARFREDTFIAAAVATGAGAAASPDARCRIRVMHAATAGGTRVRCPRHPRSARSQRRCHSTHQSWGYLPTRTRRYRDGRSSVRRPALAAQRLFGMYEDARQLAVTSAVTDDLEHANVDLEPA